MKKTAWFLSAVLVCILCGAGGAYCADVLKIGFHAPLTGFAASDGKSASEGAKLAAEQINSAGGINGKMIELVSRPEVATW